MAVIKLLEYENAEFWDIKPAREIVLENKFKFM